tara:strand:- start:5307 stop:6206 length:900 start_codon:yes stop_codon:yes gene_type:complete
MAFGFDISALPAYTDQLSLDLISKAVLKTDLLDYVDLRSGFTSGTVAINLVDAALPVSALSCGWTSDGEITYSQVNVTIESLQSKTEMCIEDLRSVYQSAFMNAGTGNDFLPFEEVISESYADKLRKYNEGFLINGFGATTGLKAQITSANGANLQGGVPAAWTATNAVEQALDLYDAIAESVKDRDDLIMVVSPDAYRALVRGLVASNLFHYDSVSGNDVVILPGTNVTVVKSSGLVGSDYKFAGPGKMILAATGLTDELDAFRFFYDEASDVMKFRAAWRLGVGVGEVNLFATNDLA